MGCTIADTVSSDDRQTSIDKAAVIAHQAYSFQPCQGGKLTYNSKAPFCHKNSQWHEEIDSGKDRKKILFGASPVQRSKSIDTFQPRLLSLDRDKIESLRG